MSRHHRKLLRRLRAICAPRGIRPTLSRVRSGWCVDAMPVVACYATHRAMALRAALDTVRA